MDSQRTFFADGGFWSRSGLEDEGNIFTCADIYGFLSLVLAEGRVEMPQYGENRDFALLRR